MYKMLNIISSKKLMSIIELFLENPNREFYQSEISRVTKMSRTTASKWLKLLEENALIKQQLMETKHYILNKDSVIVKQLKILVTVSKLCDAVKKIKDEQTEIYLFGSASRGEDAEKSDIDVLIIGKRNINLNEFIDLAGKLTKKEIKPVIKTPVEYSMLARKDRLFYENIEKDKIRLL